MNNNEDIRTLDRDFIRIRRGLQDHIHYAELNNNDTATVFISFLQDCMNLIEKQREYGQCGVVFCRDCKYHTIMATSTNVICTDGTERSRDWFCAWGRKRDE